MTFIVLIVWVWITDDKYSMHEFKMETIEECFYKSQALSRALAERPDIMGHSVECVTKDIERHEARGG